MSPAGFAYVVAVAGAAVGIWLYARLRLQPKSGRAALGCFAAAWFVTTLAPPALAAALTHLPVGPAVLLTVFPVLTASFLLTAAALSYLVGLAGHATR